MIPQLGFSPADAARRRTIAWALACGSTVRVNLPAPRPIVRNSGPLWAVFGVVAPRGAAGFLGIFGHPSVQRVAGLLKTCVSGWDTRKIAVIA